MSRFKKDSKYRLRDFRSRKNYSPDSVCIHPTLGSEYIPIHPFSDESDILKKLGMSPTECKSVDAWWNMGADMCFIEVSSISHKENREIGLYASWPKEKQKCLYFRAILDSEMITKDLFQNVMNNISEYKLIASENVRKQFSGKLTYIGKIS